MGGRMTGWGRKDIHFYHLGPIHTSMPNIFLLLHLFEGEALV